MKTWRKCLLMVCVYVGCMLLISCRKGDENPTQAGTFQGFNRRIEVKLSQRQGVLLWMPEYRSSPLNADLVVVDPAVASAYLIYLCLPKGSTASGQSTIKITTDFDSKTYNKCVIAPPVSDFSTSPQGKCAMIASVHAWGWISDASGSSACQ